MNSVAAIGRFTLGFLALTGNLARFCGIAVGHILRPPIYIRLILSQIMRIGYNSLPVVGMTALFTGAVLALQIYTGLPKYGAATAMASIVAIGITRELGPVIAGLMVAGRVSSAIAAEIGTMRVTEQIDALTTLRTNPIKYLVAPRVIAATLTLPILVAIADTIGIMGGFLVSTGRLGYNPDIYIRTTMTYITYDNVVSGLTKAAVFGFLIALMGCYNGYHSKGGAQGVGQATTTAVVTASIMILVANYMLTELFFSK